MEEMTKHGRVGVAALRAGMDRKTARTYLKLGKLPSETKKPRTWRTHEDVFAERWTEISAMLAESPGLEAKTLFEVLTEKYPGQYDDGQLRTLQRRVREWRAALGPEKDVVLAQRHRPGEAAQTDFTWTTELAVTVLGHAFEHMLCVFTLPYSNWRWATICLSESMAALRNGIQRALFQLGRVPTWHQTDNSTAATHRIPRDKRELEGKRAFNAEYLAIMRHFGMTPRTTEVGQKQQNGDVEACNGAMKRALEQALLVRGSRDFESQTAWQTFIDDLNRKTNARRERRVGEELAAMRELNVAKLREFTEEEARVSRWSTIRIRSCAYSVPSRLIGECVKVRVFEDHIVVRYNDKDQLACERIRGHGQCRIDYRHVIWSLVRKPGGFVRYVYREELFPSLTFRRAYDGIHTPHAGLQGDLEYLRILHLAASTLEADVEAALDLLLAENQAITSSAVKTIVTSKPPIAVPDLQRQPVELASYNSLLEVGT